MVSFSYTPAYSKATLLNLNFVLFPYIVLWGQAEKVGKLVYCKVDGLKGYPKDKLQKIQMLELPSRRVEQLTMNERVNLA